MSMELPKDLNVVVTPAEIIISNFSGVLAAAVYSVTGNRIATAMCYAGYTSLDISGLPQGIYFLHTGNSTMNVVKKFAVMK
jgi:hypothetical protein